MSTQAGCFSGSGGVSGVRGLLEVCQSKTNQSCLYFSGVASVCPAVMLQSSGTEEPTTAQRCSKLLPRHNTPGECWVLIKRQSQGSSQVSLQCLLTAPPDLYRQLSLLITYIHPVATLKPCFYVGCLACQLVFSSQTELRLHVQEDSEATAKAKGQNDITGVSKCSTAKLCQVETENCRSFKQFYVISHQTVSSQIQFMGFDLSGNFVWN